MSDTPDLPAFLLARLAEIEEAAQDASRRDAQWVSVQPEDPGWWKDNHDALVVAGGKPIVVSDWEHGGLLVTEHIALHDPAAVLADVEAKRRAVNEAARLLRPDPLRTEAYWRGARDVAEAMLRIWAQPYASHAAFNPAWRLDD